MPENITDLEAVTTAVALTNGGDLAMIHFHVKDHPPVVVTMRRSLLERLGLDIADVLQGEPSPAPRA